MNHCYWMYVCQEKGAWWKHLPQNDMKMAKNTVALLSKIRLARAWEQAALSFQ